MCLPATYVQFEKINQSTLCSVWHGQYMYVGSCVRTCICVRTSRECPNKRWNYLGQDSNL